MSIVNLSNTNHTIIAELMQSAFDFYLTGSRYWMNYHENSDWDFFVQESIETMDYLNSLGFRSVPNDSYHNDSMIVGVFKKEMIHIQVVSNAIHKQAVQQCLYNYFPQGFDTTKLPSVSKRFAKLMWDLAFDLTHITKTHHNPIGQEQ